MPDICLSALYLLLTIALLGSTIIPMFQEGKHRYKEVSNLPGSYNWSEAELSLKPRLIAKPATLTPNYVATYKKIN